MKITNINKLKNGECFYPMAEQFDNAFSFDGRMLEKKDDKIFDIDGFIVSTHISEKYTIVAVVEKNDKKEFKLGTFPVYIGKNKEWNVENNRNVTFDI